MKLKNNIRVCESLVMDIIRSNKRINTAEICEKYLTEKPVPPELREQTKERISACVKELFIKGKIISVGKDDEWCILWAIWDDEEIDLGESDENEHLFGNTKGEKKREKMSLASGKEILLSKRKKREKVSPFKWEMWSRNRKRKYAAVYIFVDMDNSPECLEALERNILPKELNDKHRNVNMTCYDIRAYGNYHNGWANKHSSEWFSRVEEGATTYAKITWELSYLVHKNYWPGALSLYIIASKNKALADFGPLVKATNDDSEFHFVSNLKELRKIFSERMC